MKIVAIYGDDTEKARSRVSKIIHGVKKRNWDILHIDPNKSLSEQVVARTLFDTESLYVHLEAKKLNGKEVEWISKHSDKISTRLLLFFSGTIPKDIRSRLPKDAEFEEFNLPKDVFTFLDSFWPGNSARCLELLKSIEKMNSLEFLIAMLGRHVRDLVWVQSEKDGISAQPWKKQKLSRQAERFQSGRLIEISNELARIDLESKTGKVNATLGLELLIFKYL